MKMNEKSTALHIEWHILMNQMHRICWPVDEKYAPNRRLQQVHFNFLLHNFVALLPSSVS